MTDLAKGLLKRGDRMDEAVVAYILHEALKVSGGRGCGQEGRGLQAANAGLNLCPLRASSTYTSTRPSTAM